MSSEELPNDMYLITLDVPDTASRAELPMADLPPAAVNPEGDRMPLALGRGIHVEGLSFVFRAGVGKVPMDGGLGGVGRGGKDQE